MVVQRPWIVSESSQSCPDVERAAQFARLTKIINLSAVNLVDEFARLGPWITQFVINGVSNGGDYQVINDRRVQQFLERFPNARTILELGSLEGGHTFTLARQPGVERVLAVEARAANIDKAKFIGSLLGVSNVQFKQANLEQLQLVSLGYFDAIFCCGLLYHLPEPWKLLSQAPRVAPSLFVWTVYATENEATIEIDGLRGREYVEGGLNEPLSGCSPKSIWLTLPSLLELLKRSGYREIEILDKAQNPNGSAVSLAASLN
jgi:SAM-dependent methyltransferase